MGALTESALHQPFVPSVLLLNFIKLRVIKDSDLNRRPKNNALNDGSTHSATLQGLPSGEQLPLLRVSPFNATSHAVTGALQEPHLSLFEFRQRESVFTACELPSLERLETVDKDGQQHLLRDAVDASLRNWPVLKAQSDMNSAVFGVGAVRLVQIDLIDVVCAA